MRFALTTISTLLVCFPVPVLACSDPSSETTIFFEGQPEGIAPTAIIADVTISSINDQFLPAEAHVRIDNVIQGDIKPESHIKILYFVSSCGPNQKAGDKGRIAGISGMNAKGEVILYPYLRRFGDSKLFSPELP